jgi:hypothetical protein
VRVDVAGTILADHVAKRLYTCGRLASGVRPLKRFFSIYF